MALVAIVATEAGAAAWLGACAVGATLVVTAALRAAAILVMEGAGALMAIVPTGIASGAAARVTPVVASGITTMVTAGFAMESATAFAAEVPTTLAAEAATVLPAEVPAAWAFATALEAMAAPRITTAFEPAVVIAPVAATSAIAFVAAILEALPTTIRAARVPVAAALEAIAASIPASIRAVTPRTAGTFAAEGLAAKLAGGLAWTTGLAVAALGRAFRGPAALVGGLTLGSLGLGLGEGGAGARDAGAAHGLAALAGLARLGVFTGGFLLEGQGGHARLSLQGRIGP